MTKQMRELHDARRLAMHSLSFHQRIEHYCKYPHDYCVDKLFRFNSAGQLFPALLQSAYERASVQSTAFERSLSVTVTLTHAALDELLNNIKKSLAYVQFT